MIRRSRGGAGLWLAALVSLAPTGAEAAEAPRTGSAVPTKDEEVDAELLRDLEVLNSANYARDREIAKRMSILERMRMLQTLPDGYNQQQADGALRLHHRAPGPAGWGQSYRMPRVPREIRNVPACFPSPARKRRSLTKTDGWANSSPRRIGSRCEKGP